MKIVATHNTYGSFSFSQENRLGATVSSANSPANTQASMADSTSLQSQQIHEQKKMVSNIGKEKVEETRTRISKSWRQLSPTQNPWRA